MFQKSNELADKSDNIGILNSNELAVKVDQIRC